MAQNRHPRVVLRELLLHTFGQRRGAARLGILRDDHDRRVLALAEPVVDQFRQLVDLGLHLRDDRRLGTRRDGAVERQVTRRVAHHLDEKEAFVARRRVAQFVDRLHDRIQRRVVADRRVRASEVVVDRSGKPHDRHVVFLGEKSRAGQRSVAADHHQSVDARSHHVVVSRLAAFHGLELLAAGGFQDRAAQLDDVAHALRFEFNDLVEYQTFESAHDSFYGKSVVDCAARHRADCRIHARRVAARCQNAYALDSGHTLIC